MVWYQHSNKSIQTLIYLYHATPKRQGYRNNQKPMPQRATCPTNLKQGFICLVTGVQLMCQIIMT